MLKSNEKQLDLVPLLRQTSLKQKIRRPLASQWNKRNVYVAPLDRKTYEQRVQLREKNDNCSEVIDNVIRQTSVTLSPKSKSTLTKTVSEVQLPKNVVTKATPTSKAQS